MIEWEFWIGAAAGLAILAWIIDAIRRRGPYSSRPGSVIYAIWVAEAFYGAGTRQDWKPSEAAAYVVTGFILWVIAALAERGKRARAN